MFTNPRIKHITSLDNVHFKRWKSLLESRGQKKHQEMILSGQKLIPETFNHTSVVEVLLCEGMSVSSEMDKDIRLFLLDNTLFSQIDIFGTKSPLVILKIPELKPAPWKKPPEGLELVCPVGDPINLGPILRSAEAFGAKVFLTEDACSPFLPKALRASSGSSFRLALEGRIFKAPRLANMDDLCGVALSPHGGESLNTFPWPQDARIIVGEEGQGLKDLRSSKSSIQLVHIPMEKSTESLNSAVAASLAMFSYYGAQKTL